MAQDLYRVELGLEITGANGDSGPRFIQGSGAPGGDAGIQDGASIGSIYARTDGSGGLYKKTGTANTAADWEEVGNVSLNELSWRSEKVRAATNDTLAAGSGVNPTTWTDNESGVDATNWNVGDYVIGDVDGTPALFEITAKASATSITLAAAGTAIAANDTFVVQAYLPDSPASQEVQAIVHSPDGTSLIKISDVNWDFATGINLSGSYAAGNGTISSADSVESAIQKLDGNQQDIQTASGISQGAVDYGTFTGSTLPDNATNKALHQAMETAYEETDANVDDLITLTGVAENTTDLGTFTGVTIPDSSTIKAALQSLETAVEAATDDQTAAEVPYTPAVLTDWNGDVDPGSTKDALDQLAARVDDNEINIGDLETLSGVAGATDLGTFTGDTISDSNTVKGALQELETALELISGATLIESTGASITTATNLDSPLADATQVAKWFVTAHLVSDPTRVKAFEVYAVHNGHSGADASATDFNVASKLSIGTSFNVDIDVVLSGAGAAQAMNLEVTASAAVNVKATRLNVDAL